MTEPKHFGVEIERGVTIMRLKDPKLQDMVVVSELHDELLEYLEEHHPRNLIVDYTSVTRCSSTVINSMLLARKRLKSKQGVVRLCCMRKQVRDAFRVLRLDGTLFDIHDSLAEALEAFARA
jgi:anti-anti-sigma factor